MTRSAAAAGDFFYAWGDRPNAGTFVVEKIWLNIVNLRGLVKAKSVASLELFHETGRKPFIITLDEDTVVIVGGGEGFEVFGSLADIAVGHSAQVIGVVEGGTARATRVITGDCPPC